MELSPVIATRPEKGVGVIRIDRPERRNALNLEVKRQLVAAIEAYDRDPDIAVIVLTGSDKYFVAGTDVAEMKDMSPDSHAALGTGMVFETLRASNTVMIAAVEGYALGGGCELALACDMVVAGDGARFGLPEIRVGIMPGAGGIQMLLRAAGKHRTLRMVLTGEPVGAAEAFTLGMVSEIVPSGTALDRAVELARTVGAMPPLAVKAIRDCVRQGLETGLTDALAYERRSFENLFATDDQKEGMQAFLDKRPPVFKGQ